MKFSDRITAWLEGVQILCFGILYLMTVLEFNYKLKTGLEMTNTLLFLLLFGGVIAFSTIRKISTQLDDVYRQLDNIYRQLKANAKSANKESE